MAAAERGQGGMVTVEIAFAALFAAMAAVALAWVLAVLGLSARCHDTAAEVARQEARADRSAVAKAIADRPAGAQVRVRHTGPRVVVTVRLAARPWLSWLPSVPLSATAVVIEEPS